MGNTGVKITADTGARKANGSNVRKNSKHQCQELINKLIKS